MHADGAQGDDVLAGRIAVVTGGNGGLGFAMAFALAGAGASVAVVGRNATKCGDAAQTLRDSGANAIPVVADVSTRAGASAMREEVVRRLGGVDILVNNAGVSIRRRPEDYSDQEWHDVLAANLDTAYYSSVAIYPDLVTGGQGKIINVGSMMSTLATAWSVPYAASKGAVVQLTKGLAVAWAAQNIQCNVILPGWFDTEMTQESRRRFPELQGTVERRTPAGRWGHPSDIGGAVVFLASSASDFITGASLTVDGGYSVQG
jgi:2-deoxy-D-gluconate 3-dehydrogenase